jgi:hypothetical protein
MPKFIVICHERNEEPPGPILRVVKASDKDSAMHKANLYHCELDGDFVVLGAYRPHELIAIAVQAIGRLAPHHMSKEIIFIIGDGQVELEAKGFKGGACEAATKAFEDVLGGPINNKKRKAEFYDKSPEVRINAGAKP